MLQDGEQVLFLLAQILKKSCASECNGNGFMGAAQIIVSSY